MTSTRIPHDGGACPVSPGTRVRVWFRGSSVSCDDLPAEDWCWTHCNNCGDIVAYLILEDEQKAST